MERIWWAIILSSMRSFPFGTQSSFFSRLVWSKRKLHPHGDDLLQRALYFNLCCLSFVIIHTHIDYFQQQNNSWDVELYFHESKTFDNLIKILIWFPFIISTNVYRNHIFFCSINFLSIGWKLEFIKYWQNYSHSFFIFFF